MGLTFTFEGTTYTFKSESAYNNVVEKASSASVTQAEMQMYLQMSVALGQCTTDENDLATLDDVDYEAKTTNESTITEVLNTSSYETYSQFLDGLEEGGYYKDQKDEIENALAQIADAHSQIGTIDSNSTPEEIEAALNQLNGMNQVLGDLNDIVDSTSEGLLDNLAAKFNFKTAKSGMSDDISRYIVEIQGELELAKTMAEETFNSTINEIQQDGAIDSLTTTLSSLGGGSSAEDIESTIEWGNNLAASLSDINGFIAQVSEIDEIAQTYNLELETNPADLLESLNELIAQDGKAQEALDSYTKQAAASVEEFESTNIEELNPDDVNSLGETLANLNEAALGAELDAGGLTDLLDRIEVINSNLSEYENEQNSGTGNESDEISKISDVLKARINQE